MVPLTSVYSGASRTPASPAIVLDSIQAIMLTRSASTPASSTMRGLSTTARIWSPIGVKRKMTPRIATAITVTMTIVSALAPIE